MLLDRSDPTTFIQSKEIPTVDVLVDVDYTNNEADDTSSGDEAAEDTFFHFLLRS